MRRVLGVFLLLNLGLLSKAGFGTGQEQQQQKPEPTAEPEEGKPQPYVPPSAAKSVEIAIIYFRTKKYPQALGRYEEAVTTEQ